MTIAAKRSDASETHALVQPHRFALLNARFEADDVHAMIAGVRQRFSTIFLPNPSPRNCAWT